jgi:hypothetical protein
MLRLLYHERYSAAPRQSCGHQLFPQVALPFAATLPTIVSRCNGCREGSSHACIVAQNNL